MVLLALACPEAVWAAAAQWGPGYLGEYFFIERPSFAFDLLYNYEYENRVSPFNTSKNASHSLIERLDIETAGFAYHPSFLQYKLRLSPEFEQTIDRPDPGANDNSNLFFFGYSVDLYFLPDKPYSVDLYARQQRSILNSTLATRSETSSTALGAALNLKYKIAPTTVSYAHITSDQTGFYDTTEVRDELRVHSRHERPSSDTRLDANYTAFDRTQLGSTIATQSLYSTLQNQYQIRPDNAALLNSVLSYNWGESDVYRTSNLSLNETLNWRHRTNLFSYYTLGLTRNESESTSVNRISAGAGLSHTLYENLTTLVSANADRDSDGIGVYSGNVAFAYQRAIPWGTLYASLGQGYTVNTMSSDAGPAVVLDERQTLTTGAVTTLNNQNVDQASVIVTSTDRTIVYRLDVDYRLEVIGTSTRLSRTSFGSIAEGQTVLVRYTYLREQAYDSGTYLQAYGVGVYLWDALRMNYRYTRSTESLLSGVPPPSLTDDSRQLADAELIWRWSTTRFLFDNTDSTTGISVRRWLAQQVLTFRPRDDLTLSVSGHYGETFLKESGAEEKHYGGRGDIDWWWSPRSKLRLEALYAKINGQQNNTLDKGALARIEWYYGIWRADLSYGYLDQMDFISGQSLNRHSVFMTLRRALY